MDELIVLEDLGPLFVLSKSNLYHMKIRANS